MVAKLYCEIIRLLHVYGGIFSFGPMQALDHEAPNKAGQILEAAVYE
jgi:hypothetical protein